MRIFTSLVFWIFFLPMALAQTPPPCAPGAGPSDFCNTVCLSCDFQNGTIINSTPYTPDISADDCLGIHNNFWYAFTAAETQATFSAFPTNCQTGLGIQIAIYDECQGNCLSFDYGCDGSPVSTTISNMEIGQVYYMTIDGCSGDICDIQMFIEPLSAIQAPQLGPSPPMVGPSEACPNGTITYCLTQPLDGASQYVWTIPADATLDGQQGPGPITLSGASGYCADIKFGPSLGPKQVCVRPRNACHPGQIVCKNIQVKKIPDTQLPPAILCQDEVPDFQLPWGDPINPSIGTVNYQTTLPSYIGCDSTVKISVTVLPAKFKQLPPQYACPGDCVTIGGETFCAPGNYTVQTESVQGCDSTISFQLSLIEVNPEITVNGTFNCGTSSLMLSSVPQASTQKLWKNAQGQSIGTLDNVQVSQPGQYTLTVTKTIGNVTCFRTDTVLIGSSQDIPTLSAASAGIVNCTGASVQLSTQTNANNPVFSWSGPNGFSSSAPAPAVTLGGTYSVTVSAPNGCTATASVNVATNTTIPTIQLSADSISCTVDSAQLSAQTNAALPGFAWSGPNGFTATIAQPVTFSGGLYTLIVVDSINGCRDTATVEVGLDVGVPILSAVSSGPIGCLSPSITLQATTQNGPASFAWTGPAGFVSGDSNPSVGLAGEYIVTASTPNGCTATASIVVSGDTNLPDLSVTGDTLTCTAPEANIAGSSNTAGVVLAWTGPGNFASDQSMLKVSTAGEYVLTVTAPNGCSASATVPVLSDQIPPDVAATGAGLDCLHPSVVITGTSAAANAAFSWTGPDGFSSQVPDNTVALPGDYTLTVQTPNGCTATAVASVGQDTLAPDVQALSDGDITCLHPTATLSGSSGVPAASFFWTGPGGSSNTADLSTNTGGNYLLTITHPQNGCTAQASVFVVVDTLKPLVVVASSILTCTKDSVQLLSDALGNNLSWAWAGPGNFSSAEPNPTVSLPGDYLLTLTNLDNGCVTLLTEAVQADQAPPFISAVSGQLSCTQPSLNLTASSTPPGTFAWAGPNGFVSTEADPVVQVAGSYQLTATAANGCTATTTVVVDSDFNLPGASALGDTIDCFSGSALLAGSSPDLVTWAWSGPGNFNSSEQNPQVTTAGDYTLVVTGQNGCSATATATVSLNQDAPDVDITGAAGLSCLVTSLQLSASVADPIVSGQWSTGAQSSSISISSPGTYSYTAQGLSGCITTQSVNIQQDTAAPQNVAATGGQLTCSLTTLSLNGSATGTALSWQWSGPSGFTSTAQNPANVTTPGQYILVVTDTSNGCTASATAPVTEDPSIPEISATADTLNCKEASVEIALVANRPDLTYAWSGPNGFTASQANPAVTAPGLYTLLATAPNGCTATITLSVAQDIALPEVLAQADTLSCAKLLGTLSGSSPSPGALPQWTGPGNFTATQWSTTATLAGPYQLSVTGTNGCSTATTVVMAEDKVKPKVTAKGDTLTCSVLQIALDAQADVQALWQWSGPGNFSSGIQQPFASAAGAYTVTVTGPNGCSASATAFVYADQQSPQLSILPPDEIDCQTAQVSLAAQAQGTGSFVFQWGTGNGLIVAGANTATATAGMGGLYTVTVTNAHNACTATQSVTVPVNANVPTSMNIRSSDISCYGKMDGALVVESVSGGTPPFLFSLDAAAFAAASVFQGLSPGAHTLQLQDAAGCELQSSVFLQEPGPFTVSLGPDTTIHLGAPILLAVGSAVNLPQRIDKFTTSPFQLGQDSIVFPLRSFIYTLSVSDTNGCSAAGKRLILVDKRRNVYVPNAFGPGSPSNSIFTLFGGVDVRLVHRFQIFDRWGTLIHERRQFLPQDLSAAWDGTFRGDAATPGVFAYYFEIEFIDGEVEVFSGDVTLIR